MMHFTFSIVLSAFLAGQVAIAAYIPLGPRAAEIITRTQVRTVYSTKVVFASSAAKPKPSPSAAGIGQDGLPVAPAISRLSIPFSSIPAVNPINGMPLQTVKQTAKATKPASTASKPIAVYPINGLPLPTGKKPASTASTKKPALSPAASAAAAAAIASMLAQAPKPSPSMQATAAAAAGIANIIAQAPKPTTLKTALESKPTSSKPTSNPSPIIIHPITTSLKTPGPLFTSLMAALPKPLDQLSKGTEPSSAQGIIIVPVLTNSGAPLLIAPGPTPTPNVPSIRHNKEVLTSSIKGVEAKRVLSILEAAQPRNN